MDKRTTKHDTEVAIKSTRGLLLPQPYEPQYPNSSTSSKVNATKREGNFPLWIKINELYISCTKFPTIICYILFSVNLIILFIYLWYAANSGPKLIKIVKQKLNHGAKVIQLGSLGKIFKKTFSIREEEKLLQASQCYLYTSSLCLQKGLHFSVIGHWKLILPQASC